MGEIIFDHIIPLHAISKKNRMRYWKGMVLKDPSITTYEKALINHFKANYIGTLDRDWETIPFQYLILFFLEMA